MRPRDFFKSLLLLAVVAISIFYVASSFFIAKTVADVLRPSDIIAVQLDVASVESLRGETRDGHQGTPSDVSGKKRDDVRIIAKHSQNPSAVARLRASAATMVQFAVFLGLLIVPCWIFYRFLFKPLKEFPIVAPGVLEDLKSDKSVVQENAARIVAKAMMVSVERELRALKRGDDRLDELKNDREKLSEALHKAIGGARIILGMLEQRENRAKIAARKFALMAGLTVAISSSAMGDGLGMFFWKHVLFMIRSASMDSDLAHGLFCEFMRMLCLLFSLLPALKIFVKSSMSQICLVGLALESCKVLWAALWFSKVGTCRGHILCTAFPKGQGRRRLKNLEVQRQRNLSLLAAN